MVNELHGGMKLDAHTFPAWLNASFQGMVAGVLFDETTQLIKMPLSLEDNI